MKAQKAIFIDAKTHTNKVIDFDDSKLEEMIGCRCVGCFSSKVMEGSRKEYTVYHDDEFLCRIMEGEILGRTGQCVNFDEELYGNLVLVRYGKSMTEQEIAEVQKNIIEGVYHYKHC